MKFQEGLKPRHQEFCPRNKTDEYISKKNGFEYVCDSGITIVFFLSFDECVVKKPFYCWLLTTIKPFSR